MDNRYYVRSESGNGDGSYDICLEPKETTLPEIIIGIKTEKEQSEEQLRKLARSVVNQFNEKQYENELKAKEVSTVLKFGVAFNAKRAIVEKG